MRTAFALARRDLGRYFASPTAYVFITLFVLLTGAAQFWDPEFFKNNLANLAPLNFWFPYLLLFFVPAVAMSTWADERRHGTDELLLTLPAGDFEIVMGKYLGAVGIYTVALGFSFVNFFVLSYLGHPDVGLTLASYFGYFLMGASLLAVAMIASLLTESVTVAFVLGAVFCAIPAIIGDMATLARDASAPAATTLQIALRVTAFAMIGAGIVLFAVIALVRRQSESAVHVIVLIIVALLEVVSVAYLLYDYRPFKAIAAAGVRRPFAELGGGSVSLSGMFYFASVGVVALAINYALLRGRRVASGAWHLPLRVAFLAIIGASVSIVVGRVDTRMDMTAERLHSLSKETLDAIKAVTKEKPVFIQAFVSPDAPREYVQQRETLLDLLREFDKLGGERVIVKLRETSRASEAARDARELYKIKPQEFKDTEGGGSHKQETYLGVVVTCGADEIVIPFLFKGLSPEYELTRAVRSVTKAQRRKIGVLATEAAWMGGGFDMQTYRPKSAWQVVDELNKQYEVKSVPLPSDPMGPPPEGPTFRDVAASVDVLIVPCASGLSQPAMNELLDTMKQGKPTLIFDDPKNFCGAPDPNDPRAMMGDPAARGNVARFYATLGLSWNTGEIVWDTYNPHTTLRHLPPEIVFVGPGNGVPEAISTKSVITSGLQELALIHAGRLRSTSVEGITIVPLLKAGAEYGVISSMEHSMGRPRHDPNNDPAKGEYMLAARVTGVVKASLPAEKDGTVNVVVVADIDFIHDQFFDLMRQGREQLTFDNVTFVMNAVDSLAGDDSVVALRKRRPKHRTLEKFADLTRDHERKLLEEVRLADEDTKKALEDAQKVMDEKIKEVEARTDLDVFTKFELLKSTQTAENGRLSVKRQTLEDEKDRRVEKSELSRDRAIQAIQLNIKCAALVIPFIPPFIIGLVVWIVRILRELEAKR